MNNFVEGKSYIITQNRDPKSVRVIKVLEITKLTILYQYLDHFTNPTIRSLTKDFDNMWRIVEEYIPAQTTNIGTYSVVYN